jgi:hypothetical protein
MAFEHHFLITYAHLDNEALIAGEQGWVSELHRLLEVKTATSAGSAPEGIWVLHRRIEKPLLRAVIGET